MRIALVDDNKEDLLELGRLCRDFGEKNLCRVETASFSSGESFLKSFREGGFSVVFMDIFMDGINGVATSLRLREEDSTCLLVFLTSSREFMPDAFSCHAFEYITKPISPERIFGVLADALKVLPPMQKYMEIPSGRKTARAFFADIMSVVTDAHYLDIQLSDGTVLRSRMTVSEFMERAGGDRRFISAGQIEAMLKEYQEDVNHEHMVMPGMVYLSQPTEYGTLYSHKELEEISRVCRENGLPLYMDGARLAYALACPENDVSLADIADLCDVFTIGGTKCGALFGEAVVIPQKGMIPGFFTIVKQHGALLAKGRLLGIQFDELFRDHLYEHIGESAIAFAGQIRAAWKQCGYRLYYETPTNQVFCLIKNSEMQRLAERVEFGFWEKYDEDSTVIRLATSWATREENVRELIQGFSDLHEG